MFDKSSEKILKNQKFYNNLNFINKNLEILMLNDYKDNFINEMSILTKEKNYKILNFLYKYKNDQKIIDEILNLNLLTKKTINILINLAIPKEVLKILINNFDWTNTRWTYEKNEM
ncbi:hypothetical protein [Spiroplasma taiwanense]|uniref:hypothetical protein n=1 Tax=Spiroplasma taiwanense TaxID=2145 RepID=UPI0011D2885D|nr:hypothetical protein [Spiroplasma taiwanense]